MTRDAEIEAMREALEATLQSHVRMGKARGCDCSLCHQIREALAPNSGVRHADRLREECANVADWKAGQISQALSGVKGKDAEGLRSMLKVAREIADRIRALKGSRL